MIQLTPDELLTLEALETFRAQDAAAEDVEPWYYYAVLIIRGADGQKAALQGGYALVQQAAQATINTAEAMAQQLKTAAQTKLADVTTLGLALGAPVVEGKP